MSLIATSVIFLGPLIYKLNKDLIHHHLNNAATIANQQSEQVKTLASQHAARATETTKQYVGDYSAKAQELIGNARGRSVSPTATTKPVKAPEPLLKKENMRDLPASAYRSEDFPAAPKQDFTSPVVAEQPLYTS